MPACGNCVNRGDIAFCRYVPRKNDHRKPTSESTDLPKTDQERFDHLEDLVLTLLKSQTHMQSKLGTPSDNGEVHQKNKTDEENAPRTSKENSKDTETFHENMSTPAASSRASRTLTISADYNERPSVDDAHWGLLLNEVSAGSA